MAKSEYLVPIAGWEIGRGGDRDIGTCEITQGKK
jgi:hypothetical protein